jgi:hypothetical protein
MNKHAKMLPEHRHAVPRKRTDQADAAFNQTQPLDPRAILQRAALAPQSLRPSDILRLQQTLGNRAVGLLLNGLVSSPPVPRYINDTGLPDSLKSGIETLSGFSMANVNVHYNSSQPARLNALAYAQGSDIHVAPGQERHLPHEAWHIVQQAQGRVQPTMQIKNGVPVNDDPALEQEADVMGSKSLQLGQPKSVMTTISPTTARKLKERDERSGNGTIIQPIWVKKGNEVEWVDTTDLSGYTKTNDEHGPTNEHPRDTIYVIKESGETTTTTTSAMLPITPPSGTATTSPRIRVAFQLSNSLKELLSPFLSVPVEFASAAGAWEFKMNDAPVQGNMYISNWDPYEIDARYVVKVGDNIDTKKSSRVKRYTLKKIPTTNEIFTAMKYEGNNLIYIYKGKQQISIADLTCKYHISVPWVEIDPDEAVNQNKKSYWTNLLLKSPTKKGEGLHISAEFPDKNFRVFVDKDDNRLGDPRKDPGSPVSGTTANKLMAELTRIMIAEKPKMQSELIQVLKNVFKFNWIT